MPRAQEIQQSHVINLQKSNIIGDTTHVVEKNSSIDKGIVKTNRADSHAVNKVDTQYSK